MRCSRRAWAPLALFLFAISCNHAPQPAVTRLALIPIESLAAAPERVAQAHVLAVLLRGQLTGLDDVLPLRASDGSDAIRQRATRRLQGYLTEEGSQLVLRLHERGMDGKTLRVIESRNGSITGMAGEVARQISPKARPLPDISQEAVAALGMGLMETNRASSVDWLRRAVELAPNFGEAWLNLGGALQSIGRGQDALGVYQAALNPQRGLDAVSRAQIRYLAANMTQSADLPEATLTLAKLLPADSDWQARAALVASSRRQYSQAEQWYRAGLRADPAAAVLWNEMAYAQALGGNLDGGLKSLDEYARLAPKSPNPLDSRGELLFMHSRFAEAAIAFESAYAIDPQFLEGHTLRKAAEARLLMGDKAGAQAQIDKLLKAIPATAPAGTIVQALWSHRTGRKAEAMALLGKVAQSDPAARAHLAAWLAASGKRTEATQLAGTIPGRLGVILAFVSQPPADPETWRRRGSAVFADRSLEVLRKLATIYALLIDGHDRDAAAMLKQQIDNTNPLQSRQMLGMYRQALLRSGQKEIAEREASQPPLPSSGVDAVFDFLMWER